MGSQLMGHQFFLTIIPPPVDNKVENGLDMTH